MAKGKGKKTQSKGQKKPKKARPIIQLPGLYAMGDSQTATPDYEYPRKGIR